MNEISVGKKTNGINTKKYNRMNVSRVSAHALFCLSFGLLLIDETNQLRRTRGVCAAQERYILYRLTTCPRYVRKHGYHAFLHHALDRIKLLSYYKRIASI
jgi:hypothetical protein